MALDISVGTITRPAAGTTNTVVSGLAFAPKAIIFVGSNVLTAGTWRAGLESVLGWAAKPPGESLIPVSMGAYQGANNGAAPSTRLGIAVVSTRQVSGAGVVTAAIESIAFGADSVTINWIDAGYDGEQELWGYIVLGGECLAVAGTYNANMAGIGVGSSLQLPHDVGFIPSAALVAAGQSDNPSSQSIGVRAGNGQWAVSLSDQQGTNPSNVKRMLRNDAAVHLLNPTAGTTYLKMLANLDPNGLVMDVIERGPLGSWALQNTYSTIGGTAQYALQNTYGTGVAGSGTSPLQFNTPNQVARDTNGYFFVSDSVNKRLVKLDPNGAYVTSMSTGTSTPLGIAVSPSTNKVFVLLRFSGGDHAVYRYANTLTGAAEDVATYGFGPVPRHIAADATYVYITGDGLGPTNGYAAQRRTQSPNLYSATASFAPLGSGAGQTNGAYGVAVDGTYIYVVDKGSARVNVFTLAMAFVRSFPIGANNARGISPTPSGDIVVAEHELGRVRKYTALGVLINSIVVSTPDGVLVAPDGHVYVASASGHTLTRWAETAGHLATPGQMASDSLGRVWIVDKNHDRAVRVTPAGVADAEITGIIGIGSICVDPSDNVYIANSTGTEVRLRKYTSVLALAYNKALTVGTENVTLGHAAATATHVFVVQTVTSTGGVGIWRVVSSTGFLDSPSIFANTEGSGAGQLSDPTGIAYHSATDLLYVVDKLNSRVNSYTPAGAYVATFALPTNTYQGVIVDSYGALWLADPGAGVATRYSTTGVWSHTLTNAGVHGLALTAAGVLWLNSQSANTLKTWIETENITMTVLYLGGINADAGVSEKPTTAAPVAQTLGAAIRAKALLIATDAGPVVNTLADHVRFSYGVSDGTNHRVVTAQVQDNLGTSNADARFGGGLVVVKADNATASDEATATASFPGNVPTLNWTVNDAVATPIAWLALGDPGPTFSSLMASVSNMVPERVGNPVAFAMTIDAALGVRVVLGDSGNLGLVPMASTTDMSADGIGFDILLDSVIDLALAMEPLGIGFDRNLAMDVAMALEMINGKLGVDAPLAATTMASVSTMTALGLTLDHNLASTINSTLVMHPRFKIPLPVIAQHGPHDIPGTTNWHINPSAEGVEPTGWAVSGSATGAVTAERSWDGRQSYKVVASGASQLVMRGVSGLFLTGPNALGDSRTMWGFVHLASTVAGRTADIYLQARYEDGTTQTGEASRISTTTDFLPYYAPGLVVDQAKVLDYIELIVAPATFPTTLYADGIQLEEDRGWGPTAWAIGGYGRETGYWTGPPHLSVTGRDPVRMIYTGTGRGGDIVIEARMYRATYDNQWLEDVSDAVLSATVTMNPERESTWSLDATLTWEGYQRLLVNQDWLAPVLTVYHSDGTVRQGQLGLYFVVPSEAERGEFQSKVKLSAFDPLWLLDRQGFLNHYVARPGTDRIDHVNQILDEAVFTGGDQNPKRWRLAKSGKEFRKRHEWERKTSRLKVANEILESSGFWPLFTTKQGIIRSRRMGPERVADRAPVRVWTAHLPEGQTVAGWLPRINTLKSEVVGTIKTVPKAQDMFDEILLISGDFDGQNIHVRGRIKGKRKDKEKERERHNERQRDRDKERNRNRPRQQVLEDRREKRDERIAERREEKRETRQERREERRDDKDGGGREQQRDDRNRRDRRDRKHRNDRRDDDDRRDKDKRDNKRDFGQGKGRSRAKRIYAPLVDDEATAAEIAAALTDDLSNRTEGVTLSVLPDPSPEYARETVILNIRDAYGEEVAIGKFLVRSIKWGFTPTTCLQQMELDYVDASDAVIELS